MTAAGFQVRILGIASAFPPGVRTSADVEKRIAAASDGFVFNPGIVEMMSGVRERRYAEDDVQGSDLAAEAARKVLAKTGTAASEIDLVIYASAGQDLLEPATANIVQEKVGTSAPVFDVKNACNSFLNALQVAEAFVQTGQARRVLITTGEIGSRVIQWKNRHLGDLRQNFVGYTVGDAGAAAVVGATKEGRGIFHRSFVTHSKWWEAATIPGGGTMHPRGDEWSYVRGDGTKLKEAFLELGPSSLQAALKSTGTTFSDFRRIFVHQVTMPFVEAFVAATGVPMEKIEITLPQYGNMGAASMPAAFVQAEERGAIARGDLALWIGLAGGISLGVVMTEV